MKNIIFIAPPAAGKGTISEKLMEKYQYKHISTGDILREMASRKDDFGKNLQSLLSSGQLVPDEIVYEALKRRLMMNDLDNGYILDGFPRNLNQANEYDKILLETGRDLGVVIYLDTPKENQFFSKFLIIFQISGQKVGKNFVKWAKMPIFASSH